MALTLQKDLPLSLCPQENNPDGIKYQGRLQEVGTESIIVSVPPSIPCPPGTNVRAEFRIDKSQYAFDSSVQSLDGGKIYLHKPKAIHRSKLREGKRVTTDMKLHYTPWTESGRFETKLMDMSDLGIRMQGRRELKKGTLISLDFYVKEDKIRVLCQGQVAWCKQDPENEFLFETGVEFTTISNETRRRLNRFIEKQTGGTVTPE